MAKSNRATRKELETIVQEIIKELEFLRQGFTVLDNYLGAYVKYKGDAIEFNEFVRKQIDKRQQEVDTRVDKPKEKDVKSAKKSRYNKISTPPL